MKLHEKDSGREFLLRVAENERQRKRISDEPENEDSMILNSRIQNKARLFKTAQDCHILPTHCVQNDPVI